MKFLKGKIIMSFLNIKNKTECIGFFTKTTSKEATIIIIEIIKNITILNNDT